MKRLFGTQGFRGLANQELTSTIAHDVGLALANYLNQEGMVVVGWDSRTTNIMLSHAISSGLMAGGCNVRLLGLVPTPLLSFMIPRWKYTAGVMITASHNPPEYNGIKLWSEDGASFTSDMERQIETLFYQKPQPRAPWNQCGQLQYGEQPHHLYISNLLENVDISLIKKRPLRVVADCGGGAASVIVPSLLQQAGVEVHPLFCAPDGLFRDRLPEPKAENLAKLITSVNENNADVGMAWDGDADRVVLVTGKGRYLMGDRTFAFASYQWLRKLGTSQQKKIVTQVATSDVILDVARLVNAELISTQVGEPHIVEKMKEENAQIGGEENGGVIYQGWSWAREGLLTALIILELMAQENQPLEEIDQQFPAYAQVKGGIPCSNDQKAPLLEKVATLVPSNAESEFLDGVKLRYPDGWVLLRPSGTEPTFRVFAEAKTKNRAKSLVQMGLKLIKEAQTEIPSKTTKAD